MDLFLLSSLLTPRDWDKVDDLNEYFLSRRRWFYPLLALTMMIDLLDSYMKDGLPYIAGTGVLTWSQNIVTQPVTIIGFRSTRIRTHSIMGLAYFVWQAVVGFDFYLLLHG